MRTLLMIIALGIAAQAGQITGRVVDTNGDPVILAQINGYAPGCGKGIVMHSRTQPDGWYIMSTPSRPCFLFTLYARRDGYVTSWPHILMGSANGTIDFVLERTAKPKFLQPGQ